MTGTSRESPSYASQICFPFCDALQVAEQFERDLEYLGITGVRDKLQAYVPETLELMMEAGIRVWIATGAFFAYRPSCSSV